MATFAVTIFNAHSDETVDGTDIVNTSAQLSGAQAQAAGSAVSSPQISNPVDVQLAGAAITATSGDLVPPTEFPLPHNIMGGILSGASNRLFDTDSQLYTLGRVMHWCMPQLKNMVATSQRPDQVQNWTDLRADNPLFSAGFHFSPFLTTRAFREETDDFRRYLYDYLQTQHRKQVVTHFDANLWEDELNTCETPVSGFAQTLISINPNHTGDNDSGLREWLSDAWTDFICGTTLSTLPITAGDVSDFMYACTDNTAINKLGPNDSMHRTAGYWDPDEDDDDRVWTKYPEATGTVASITSYRSGTSNTHVKKVVLNQTLPDGIKDLNQPPIVFFPGSGSTKFIAYRIESISGATVTLKNLAKAAANDQTAIPEAGWKYSINDPTKATRTRSADWDKDGNAEGSHDGAAIWNPQLLATHALVNTKVLAAKSHETMRGWNGIGSGFTGKKQGWRVPHDQAESQDVALMENASSADWHWKIDTDDHGYRISSTGSAGKKYKPKDHQLALHWAGTYIRSPSNFAKQHARGAFVEFMLWGEGEINHTWEVTKKNVIDCHAARYHLACIIPVENVNFSIQVQSPALTSAYTLTEGFLDLETGGVEPQDFGTYRQGKGETSDTERLDHDWTFRSPDAGERIYIYRCGNFLVCVNMADKPSDYGTMYRPPGHASPFAVRNNKDQIKKADWEALVTKGILAATDKLKKIDATTYVNNRATAFVQSQAPTIWGPDNPKGSFSYGPRQATPFDDIATPLSDLDLIMHDDDWNDGSEVSTEETLDLPVWTAYFLEIY